VPTGSREALKAVNAINQLHQQSFARLAGTIPSNEFPINGILRLLRIALDLEGDRVFRI